MFRGSRNSERGPQQSVNIPPPQGSYPVQQYYTPQQAPQNYGAPPSAPPPAPAYYEPPPPYSQTAQPPPPPGYRTQQHMYGPMASQPQPATAHAVFDAAARFDGASQPRIPPPPPGCAPTTAQMAQAQGQTVTATQQRSDLFSGSGGGGISWGI